RLSSVGGLVQCQRELGLAGPIGRRQGLDRLPGALGLLVAQSKMIPRKARTLFGRTDNDFTLKLEARRRSAVEIAAIDRKLRPICLGYALASGCKFELHPILNVVLD